MEFAGQGIDRVNSSLDYTLPDNVENLTLTGAAVRALGNSLANALVGNSAANLLSGGAGADRMEGGLGNDIYFRDDAGDTVVEFAGQEIDRVNSSLDYTLPDNVENLTLTGAAVRALGNSLANALVGNSAANELNGGLGADVLTGGEGDDHFVFLSTFDSTATDPDTIADFEHLEDIMDLSSIDADTGTIGDQAFTFVGSNTFSNAAGELRYSAGLVAGDVDGDGVADMEIEIANLAVLTADDFIL